MSIKYYRSGELNNRRGNSGMRITKVVPIRLVIVSIFILPKLKFSENLSYLIA